MELNSKMGQKIRISGSEKKQTSDFLSPFQVSVEGVLMIFRPNCPRTRIFVAIIIKIPPDCADKD
jgi:hypothetical protein